MNDSSAPLTDRRIGIPESRQLDLFADMLEKRGALVTRCPLVDIHDAPDPTPVRAWFDNVVEQGLDDMIWLTGEGVRRLRDFAERVDQQSSVRFWQRMHATRTITRGPKPVRELKKHDIGTDLPATEPTTAGIINALVGHDLNGHRVGVQLYGTDPNSPLMSALSEHGAIALPVAPYVYADQAEDEAVVAFIQAMIDGRLDAVAFTSSPQVRRLFKVARRQAIEAELQRALDDICVAAVGPLVADALSERGITVDLMPESNYFMKPLVRAVVQHFTMR
ncbi:uroporphyrinogen-III synthase [Salinisphaera sp. SPP-AMP-43]|uniref:uroporphyrinogen-III synthase n=1 Tax=Salinisphaera sp. SPP-AMP-43 TaxID=3121288 RepID=UPI003C6E209C